MNTTSRSRTRNLPVMTPVEHFIYQQEGKQREILAFLHEHLLTYPGMEAKLRYKIPFFYRKTWICYTNPLKGDAIELVFVRGNELSNIQGLLEARGRKQVRGVVCKEVENIPVATLTEVIQEALILDAEIPYASKRRKL